MHTRYKALVAGVLLLMLHQSTHAAFNILDEPEPEAEVEAPEIDPWSSYNRTPIRSPNPILSAGPALYRQVARPAVYKPNEEPVPGSVIDPQSLETAGVVEIGLPDVNIPIINRAGKNKPLPDALRAILPKGWHAKKRAEVSRNMLISWGNGWDWVTTLNDVAKDYGLSIVVEWNSQTVTVLKSKQEEPKEQAQKPEHEHNVYVVSSEKWQEIKPKSNQAGSKGLIDLPPLQTEKPIVATELDKGPDRVATTPITPITPITPVPKTSPAKPAKYEPALHLSAGRKMSESLETWTKETGWNLIWEAKVDYPISVNTTLSGSADEIITQFGDAVVHSHLPLHVDVYKLNRVIRVSN